MTSAKTTIFIFFTFLSHFWTDNRIGRFSFVVFIATAFVSQLLTWAHSDVSYAESFLLIFIYKYKFRVWSDRSIKLCFFRRFIIKIQKHYLDVVNEWFIVFFSLEFIVFLRLFSSLRLAIQIRLRKVFVGWIRGICKPRRETCEIYKQAQRPLQPSLMPCPVWTSPVYDKWSGFRSWKMGIL